jgi:hypothetical protein
MNPSACPAIDLIDDAPAAKLIGLAVRCARLAMRVLNRMSFPVGVPELTVLDRTLNLADTAAAGPAPPVLLEAAIEETGRLAFKFLAQLQFKTDFLLGQTAHAVHAAARAALADSVEQAGDAITYALEVARAAGDREVEWLIEDELRKAVAEASPQRLGSVQTA